MFLWRRDGIMLAFAMLFPTLATALYFVVFAGTPWMQPVYSACKVFQFALPILWVWAVQREPIRMRLFDPNGVAMGFGFGACVVAALLGVYYALPRDGDLYLNLQRQVAVKLEQIGIVQPVLFLLMAAFLAVIHSLFEEYYWRWFVFGQLRRGIPVVFAVILSGLAFALHHVIVIDVYLKGQDRWTLLPAFAGAVAVGGMVWAYIYHRSGSMAGPWLSHFLVDAGIMWIGFDLWRGNTPS